LQYLDRKKVQGKNSEEYKMKRTFVVPDDKETVYEKFKAHVPEVSSKLVELMEEYVCKQEAVSKQMTLLPVHEGTEFVADNIFKGDSAKFYGVKISSGTFFKSDKMSIDKTIYLTKKGKFLVYSTTTKQLEREIVYSYNIYEDYFEMKEKAELSRDMISKCEAYLDKNSVVRTFKVLDV
jgi:hypothetical protein